MTVPLSTAVWLRDHRAALEKSRDALRANELLWGWARLATFLVAAVGWAPLRAEPAAAVPTALTGLVAFGYCVKVHRRRRAARESAERAVLVLTEAQSRCGGKQIVIRSIQRPPDAPSPDAALDQFIDRGRAWPLTPQELDDLDIFAAPVGLFGLLNRTSSAIGARRLRDALESQPLDPTVINTLQSATRALRDDRAARVRLLAAAAALRGPDSHLDPLVAAIRTATPLPANIPVAGLRLWGAISLLIILFAVVRFVSGATAGSTSIALGLLLVNGSIYAALLRRTLNPALAPWRSLWKVVDALIIALADNDALPADGPLGRIRDATLPAARSLLPALVAPLYWADTGGLMHTTLNTLIFYDLHVADVLFTRVAAKRAELLTALAAFADLEVFASLACFADEQPVADFPAFVPETALTITGGHHPLLEPGRSIPNSVTLNSKQHLWLITGSNMAGKSTFLRMIGLNALLAQMGSTVCAAKMSLAPLRLITDLRARDNLADNASYFMAEVRHIRRIVVPPADPAPVLGLIDEPFRGTNSLDQSAAGIALVRHLIQSQGLYIIATHDRHMTKQPDEVQSANFHFEENLGEHGPVFDYKLHPGPAKTRNALAILEREGYPAPLLDSARRWAEETLHGEQYQ